MKASKYLLPLLMSASLFTGVAVAQTTTAPDAQTQTQMRNEVPDSTTRVDIDLPDAPDVNVTSPETNTTTTRETVTERNNTTIIDDANDADALSGNNLWIYVLFGILALFLIGLMMMSARRRTVYED